MAGAASSAAPSSLSDALRQLDNCKSANQIYSTLVIIRTNYSKGNEAATKLRHLGGVEKLLKLLSDVENFKCLDVALSILGNCCLDDKVRLRVLKCGGIKILCDILRDAQKESVRHRACRAITNLCENIACCDAIYDGHAEIISVIVTSLSETTDKECQITFCRAIRMLSDTDEHREIVLGCGAIKPVAAMLSSDETCVVQAAMKTTMHFVNNCTEECARQLASEGVLSFLVTLTSSVSSSIAATATSILLSVATNVPRLRPFLSGAGAIQFFIRQVIRLQDSLESRAGYRVVDAICHCCRDANSRMKIREYDGLELLVKLLSRERFVLIHDRIISSLVCFLFDDAGVEGLLQHGIIGTLIQHLYRSASITRQSDVIELSWLKSSRVKTISLMSNSNEDLPLNVTTECESVTGVRVDRSSEPNLNESPPSCLAKESADACRGLSISSIAVALSGEECERSGHGDEPHIGAQDAELPIDIGEGSSIREKSPPSYSMHSPTYKAVSMWRMNASKDDSVDATPRNIYESAVLFTDSMSPPQSYCSSRSASSSSSRSSSVSSPCRSSSPTYSFDSCESSPVHGGMHVSRSWPVNLGSASPRSCSSWSGSSPAGSHVHGSFSPFSVVSYLSPSQSSSPSCNTEYTDYDIDYPTSVNLDGIEFVSHHAIAHELDRNEVVDDSASVLNVDTRTTESRCCKENSNVRKSDRFLLDKMKMKIEDEDSSKKSLDVSPSHSTYAIQQQHSNIVDTAAVVCSSQSVLATTASVSSVFSESVVAPDRSKFSEDCDTHNESDDEDVLDVEAYQRSRDDQRRLSRMIDVANSMYAGVGSSSSCISEVVPSPAPVGLFRRHKRRRSSPSTATAQSVLETDTMQTLKVSSAAKARRIDVELIAAIPSCNTCDKFEEKIIKLELKSEESVSTSDDSTRRRTPTSVQTEKNILNLISRVSHLPDPSSYLVNTAVLSALLDYFAQAHVPVQTCARILLRLSRDHNCFEVAVLCLYPLLTNRRLDSSWRMTCHKTAATVPLNRINVELLHSSRGQASSKIESHCASPRVKMENESINVEHDKNIIYKPCVKLEISVSQLVKNAKVDDSRDVKKVKMEHLDKVNEVSDAATKKLYSPSDLHKEIIANMSVMASSGYGQGVLSHILLRGDHRQRELCAISLCFLCRNSALQRKFLAEMKGIDLLMDLLKDPGNKLFSSVVLALCHIVEQLPISFVQQPVKTNLSKLVIETDDKLPKSATQNDFAFVLDDGQSVSASRDILAKCSDIFAKMLRGSFKEATESSIRIPGVSLGAMRMLISLLHGSSFDYTSQSESIDVDAILDCFELSHRFQLPDHVFVALYEQLLTQLFCDLDFPYTFNILSTYGLAFLLRDFVLRLFTVDVFLEHRCSAVSDIVRGVDSTEFLSVLSASLFELMCK